MREPRFRLRERAACGSVKPHRGERSRTAGGTTARHRTGAGGRQRGGRGPLPASPRAAAPAHSRVPPGPAASASSSSVGPAGQPLGRERERRLLSTSEPREEVLVPYGRKGGLESCGVLGGWMRESRESGSKNNLLRWPLVKGERRVPQAALRGPCTPTVKVPRAALFRWAH